MVAFVPEYLCGTAPWFYRIPFTQQQLELLQTDAHYHIRYAVILSTPNIVFFVKIRQTVYHGGKSYFLVLPDPFLRVGVTFFCMSTLTEICPFMLFI
jgi:hypothetical protein